MEEIPVKVAVRIRPLLPKEILYNHQVCVRPVPNTQQVIIGKDRIFTFDFVFGQKSSQDEIYITCIKPLVTSLIEGYNATVFAYGQTGSGKTYTIGGGHVVSVSEEEKGIIPRAIQEIFQSICENHNIDFTVKISYIEVHKEELKDLLELETSTKDLHIREDEKGNTVIIGAKECQVESADEVVSLLEAGNAARHTGTTQMNEHSSRSHAIFTISVVQQRPKQSGSGNDTYITDNGTRRSVQLIASKFHFVDLAGSERVTKTGNTGERFKESIQINSGLLALGNVISALGDPKRKSAHIPYRDAKITRLLKDSLGGNAKTVMITCISPSSSSFDESLNSLKYANRAKNIRNKPIVNYNPDWDRMDEMELEIKALREALQNQHMSLGTHTSQASQELLGQEKTRIRCLEEQLAQLQAECYHYRSCTEEAYRLLVELRSTVSLTNCQQCKVQEWLDTAGELRSEVPSTPGADSGLGSGGEETHHITILQLKRELKKCQDALAIDEEVFSHKDAQLQELKEKLKVMVQKNRDYIAVVKEAQDSHCLQSEKMVEQQLQIEQLKEELQQVMLARLSFSKEGCEGEIDAMTSNRRPHSVPLTNHQPLSLSVAQSSQRPSSRKVHTSPPTYSLEKVVAGFRTRNQLLLGHIEEQDEVLQPEFSDHSDEEEEKNKENVKKSNFRRCINRTWTRKQAPLLNGSELSRDVVQLPASCMQHNGGPDPETAAEEECLRRSQTLNMQKLKGAELRLTHAKQKMRELAINIRMKEELIKELVKTGKDAQAVNKQYSLKITQLEREAEQAKAELGETQKQLQELENKELRDNTENSRLQKEFRKKMDAAKTKVQDLQKKQQDTKKLASVSAQSEKRLVELEQNVTHMKQQQVQLQKKLREEAEKKKKLEAAIQRDQQCIKDLQLKTEQQQKMLKIKTEEIAAFKRLKRAVGTPDEQQKLEEQRKWLDEEVEKVLQQHQALADLEQDLKKRETIVNKKEALLQEKSQLEIKKLRSSQALNKDILKLSTRLSALDKELTAKTSLLQCSSAEEKWKISEEVQVLQQERSQLLKRRGSLDEKLKHGRVLSPEEEHILFQLEEGIEALDAAIEYKNETIESRQHSLKAAAQSFTQSEANVMVKLDSLSASETKALLFKYFNKVVGLREVERKLQLQCEEMGMKVNELENIVHELESALQRLPLETDRRLTLQQKEHEQKLQLIFQQIKEQGSEGLAENMKMYEAKVQQLEKDLFFYKKTSRELKKKMKELVVTSLNQQSSSSKNNGAGDGMMEGMGASSEELRWASKLESSQTSGKFRTSSPSASARTQQNSKLWEEVMEIAQTPQSLPQSRKRLSSRERQSSVDETQSLKAPAQVSSRSQTGENAVQLLGVTPVRVSRRELRPILTSELSLRRSSLGTSANLLPDSIEISRKSTDFKI
ncbi:kinesin-like protein KIF27 [Latimeria chalumnae]|uniref:kinesin-like protein KIF27 n=1 Tax=Latimeria chalumnae TaxID=7897 RepID=UPI00313C87A1